MIAQIMIEEISGILTLLGKTADKSLLTAMSKLPVQEIKEYRNSLALEFEIMNPNKKLLLEDNV